MKWAIAGLVLLAFATACLMWRVAPPSEPKLNKIPLSDWVADINNRSQEENRAAAAKFGERETAWLIWATENGCGPAEPAPFLADLTEKIQRIVGKPDAYDYRSDAIQALGYLPAHKDIIPTLIRLLDSPNEDSADAAAATLNQMLPHSLPAITENAHQGSLDAQNRMLLFFHLTNVSASLQPHHIQTIASLWIKALQSGDPNTCYAALRSLRASATVVKREPCGRSLLSALLALFGDPDHLVRSTAYEVASAWGQADRASIEEAAALLHSPDPRVVENAALALATLDAKEKLSTSELLAVTQHRHLSCRAAAAKALGDFGLPQKEVIHEVTRQLMDPAEAKRTEAIRMLQRIGASAADSIPDILKALEPEPKKLAAFIRHLDSHFRGAAYPHIIHALSHSDAQIRAAAAAAFERDLTRYADQQTSAALEEVLRDSNREVRTSAQRALNRIREVQARQAKKQPAQK